MNTALVAKGDARTAAGPGPRLRRLWLAPLWAHVAVLAAVLALLYPLMSPSSAYTSDEGAYALQERSLERGSWTYDYRAAPLDPDGRAFPIILSDQGESGYLPYAKHPAYPLLLRASTAVAGPVLGLHLPALLGLIGTAIAAWLLAGQLDPRLRRPAFWLAAGGPVLVNGFLLWAHAPSAALAGFALVGAAVLAGGGRGPRAWVAVGAALAAGVLLRSEGLLFAAALTVVLAAVVLRRDGLRRAAVTLAAVGLPPVAVALLEREWVGSIIGSPRETLATRGGGGSSSFLAGRLSGAWHVLMQGHFVDPAAGLPLLLGLVLVTGLGVVALRRWGPSSLGKLALGVGLAAGFVVFRFLGHPADPVTGLLPAWPLTALGLLLFRWRGAGPVAHLLGGTSLLCAAAVLATQYSEGGGVEWGGRFLSPLLVPIAVLAVAGLVRALDSVPSPARRPATALLVALGLVSAGFAVASVGNLRSRQDDLVSAISRHPAAVTVTTRASLPRLAWRSDARVTWMLTDEAGLPGLLGDLRRAGVAEVAVVTSTDVPLTELRAYPALDPVPEPALRSSGLQLVVARAESGDR